MKYYRFIVSSLLVLAFFVACSLGSSPSHTSTGSGMRQEGFEGVPYTLSSGLFEVVDSLGTSPEGWPQLHITLGPKEGHPLIENHYDEFRFKLSYRYAEDGGLSHYIDSTYLVDLRGDLNNLSLEEINLQSHESLDESSSVTYLGGGNFEIKLVFNPEGFLFHNSAEGNLYWIREISLEGLTKTNMLETKPFVAYYGEDFPLSYCNALDGGIMFTHNSTHQRYIIALDDFPSCDFDIIKRV